jgi:hypothetical protein
MHFTNLTPVRTARFAGRLATFTFAAFFAAAVGSAQTQPPAQTPPAQQPSSSSSDGQTPSQAAPGTVPIANPNAVAALAPGHGPSYNNKWDIFGGLLFMNGQAGQNLPKRYNLGGFEGQVTYWLTPRWGIAGDYRWAAGTTPVLPNPIYNRPLVFQNIFAGGVQYRGPKNRYVAVNLHAFAGGDYGDFDHSIETYPNPPSPFVACPEQSSSSQGNIGLYCNHVAPWGAIGGTIDLNQGSRFAIRLGPDLILEHFGTETRVFVGVSGGVVYRVRRRH